MEKVLRNGTVLVALVCIFVLAVLVATAQNATKAGDSVICDVTCAEAYNALGISFKEDMGQRVTVMVRSAKAKRTEDAAAKLTPEELKTALDAAVSAKEGR